MKIIYKGFLTLIFTINCVSLFAQQSFKFRADIGAAGAGGFYKIPLSPDLLSKSNADLSDIRLAAADGKFVPYIFGNLLPEKKNGSFLAFPTTKPLLSDTATIFIMQNISLYAVDHLCLDIGSIAVPHKAYLTGTYDLKKWYPVKSDIVFGIRARSNGDHERLINFPSNTYAYFKLVIANKQKEVLNLLTTGVYQAAAPSDPVYVQYPTTSIVQYDSTGISRIQIHFKSKYRIDKLKIDVEGAKFYKRKIAIYQAAGTQFELVFTGELNSATPPEFNFTAKADNLVLEIENGDNPPLAIKAAIASALEQTLIGYLEKNTEYHLLTGDSLATAPNYDLAFFADSLQRPLPYLTHAEMVKNTLSQPAKSPTVPVWVIWGAITVAVLALLLLTFKMTKEVNKRAANNKE